jgi:thiol-disulfide isomerase/thioredoxin
MATISTHPSFRRLSLHADGDLDAQAQHEVALHLERCARCRATVERIRLLDAEARALPAPPLPAGSLERLLARHRSGEQVLLPPGDPPVRQAARVRGWAAAAAIVAAVVMGAPFVFPGAELQANRSELVVSPAAPRPGATVRVEYRGGSRFAGEQRLRLRARYLKPGDPPVPGFGRQATVADLVRGEGGTFHGTLRLPDSVVYAAMAVEDPEGSQVDSNGRKLWELLVHDADGRPMLEALMQRQFDHLARNWELSHENARHAAALYPDRVIAWFNLYTSELASFSGPAEDSARARARARLAEFDRRLRPRTDLDVETELGIMARFAHEAGDTARRRYWRGRLLREAPNSIWGVQEQFFDVMAHEPPQALARFDSLWSGIVSGPGTLIVLPVAAMLAESTGDPEAIRRWAARDLRHGYEPARAEYVGEMLARHPALREEGMALLRGRLRELERVDDAVRPLEHGVADEMRERREAAGRVFATLGAALLESGRRGAALDTLARATETGWDAALFRQVAGLRLEAGDTAGAALPLALAATDPMSGAALRDSARVLLGSRFDEAAWRGRLAAARSEMRARLFVHATDRRLPRDVRLRDAEGRTVELREAAAGRPTFVAFWYRFCPPSAAQVPLLQRVATTARAQGHAVVTVSEPLGPDFRRYLREQRLTLPVYEDPREELKKALGKWGTPEYYVLDADGRVRFGPLRSWHLTRVPALLDLLADEGGGNPVRSRAR